jgi:phycocyanobilin lyase subunit beta
MMKWQWFPEDLLEIAQEEALEALLFVAQQDDEWVVRYSAVVGLQALADAIATTYPAWRLLIQQQFEQMANADESWAVRARVWMAQQQLQTGTALVVPQHKDDQPSPLSSMDWQMILEGLYQRKGQERTVFAEGDPRRYRPLAVAIAQQSDRA